MTVLSRLNAFLPAISAANRDLEGEIAAGTIAQRNIENVSEKEEAYIEMVSLHKLILRCALGYGGGGPGGKSSRMDTNVQMRSCRISASASSSK